MHLKQESDGQVMMCIHVLPVVIGALGGGIKTLRKDLKKVFHNNELLAEVVATMQKTVLMDSESIIRRVMSGLIQGEEDEWFSRTFN